MQSICDNATVQLSPTPERVPSPQQFPVVPVQNHFPPMHMLTAEEQAHSDERCLAFLDANSFAADGLEASMSVASEAQCDTGMEVDYNIPAGDENDSRCPLGLDDGDAPDKEEEPSVGSGKSHQCPGCISKSNWKKLKSTFIKLDADIDQLATNTGRTCDNIISLWQNTHSLKRALLSALQSPICNRLLVM